MMRLLMILLISGCAVAVSMGEEPIRANPSEIGFMPRAFGGPPVPTDCAADAHVFPINLATALHLARVRPIDIELAAERVRSAAALLELARAAWLPSISFGAAYDRHDGNFQNSDGSISSDSRSSLMFGAGPGIGTTSIFSINDAIFGPLSARQIVHARQAEQQATTNDVMVAVTDAYFTVEQARGELAGAVDATHRTEELLHRVEKLAEGLVPPLEVTRAQTELASRQQAEDIARERWQVASAQLLGTLHLDATEQVDPLEPPDLRVVLIDTDQPVENLMALALTNRPELAAERAQIQAALDQVRQEKLRPVLPILWVRGFSTGASGTLAGGAFGGGSDAHIGNFGGRGDFDVQLLWQLDNLGFGNRARVHERQSNYRSANLELLRRQDRVTTEVAQAYAQARLAARRALTTERGVKFAQESYEKNLRAIGQTRRAGELVQTIVRPQEVLAAIQSLAQAYQNFYLAIADSNRAQFRLYRAIGQPAQLLKGGPDAPCCAVPDKSGQPNVKAAE